MFCRGWFTERLDVKCYNNNNNNNNNNKKKNKDDINRLDEFMTLQMILERDMSQFLFCIAEADNKGLSLLKLVSFSRLFCKLMTHTGPYHLMVNIIVVNTYMHTVQNRLLQWILYHHHWFFSTSVESVSPENTILPIKNTVLVSVGSSLI